MLNWTKIYEKWKWIYGKFDRSTILSAIIDSRCNGSKRHRIARVRIRKTVRLLPFM